MIHKNEYLQALERLLALSYLLCSFYCLPRELNSFHAIWWKERLSLVVCVKEKKNLSNLRDAVISFSASGGNWRSWPNPFNNNNKKKTYVYVSPFVPRLDSHFENFIKYMSPSSRLWWNFYVFRQRNTILSDKLSSWCGTQLKIVVWEKVSFTFLPYRARREGTIR